MYCPYFSDAEGNKFRLRRLTLVTKLSPLLFNSNLQYNSSRLGCLMSSLFISHILLIYLLQVLVGSSYIHTLREGFIYS